MRLGADTPLSVDPDELNACVQCGLCLSSCPTYRLTGDEAYSPRGRIALMRMGQDDGAAIDADMVDAFETCIQCRGCETACPSGVRFGHLIERTNKALAAGRRRTPWWQRLAFRALGHAWLLRLLTLVGTVGSRVSRLPGKLGFPSGLPLARGRLNATGHDVYLFTGCIMDMWQRPVHEASLRVLEAVGIGAMPTSGLAACCGALELHGGLSEAAQRRARSVIASLGDGRPILVNAAGCGAAMKEYGQLLGTERARRFSANVYDIHEWLVVRGFTFPSVDPLDVTVAIQDPCHLRHAQRAHESTWDLLKPFVAGLVELDDEGLCCGAGGTYSLMQPDIASQLADLKLASIGRAEPDIVASANPGCAIHLSRGIYPIAHPMEVVDAALNGGWMRDSHATTRLA